MDFRQANAEFKRLKVRFEAGELSEAEFKAQLRDLMVQDAQGAWWMIGYETERWYRHDGTTWVQVDPPVSLPREDAPVARARPDSRGSEPAEPAPPASAVKKAASQPVRRPILLIAVAAAVIVLAGGYFLMTSPPKGAAPAATSTQGMDLPVVEKPTLPASQAPEPAALPSQTSTAVPAASPTPEPSQTPEPEFRVMISSSRAILFQGPGLDYSDVKIYPRGEEFIVLARNPFGDWLLVRAADGNEGWLYDAWVDADFDLLTVPTATFIPAPPPPTRKPKDVNPPTQPCC